jgi:hypothetical protein
MDGAGVVADQRRRPGRAWARRSHGRGAGDDVDPAPAPPLEDVHVAGELLEPLGVEGEGQGGV